MRFRNSLKCVTAAAMVAGFIVALPVANAQAATATVTFLDSTARYEHCLYFGNDGSYSGNTVKIGAGLSPKVSNVPLLTIGLSEYRGSQCTEKDSDILKQASVKVTGDMTIDLAKY
ncbi:hypothetical protein [Streptomyces sp. NPDC050759]|uniref:hypothetical protein n=1 Tax=Streptomyces sp. NPDC050759 TaxID=3365635 RepID=UPI0037975E26